MPMRPRTDTGYVRGRFLRAGTPLLSAVWTKGENALLGDRFGMQSGIPDWPPRVPHGALSRRYQAKSGFGRCCRIRSG